MDKFYDVVIIGAGPAGMGCAVELMKNGVSPCVIDKAVFPRKKTCAGLVTGKTYKLIEGIFDGMDTDGLFCFTSSRVRLFQRNRELVSAQPTNAVRLVNRDVFDNALVERYRALGGAILEGERDHEIDHDGRRIKLSGGDTIGYKYIVFADGALSRSHKLLKIDKSRMACGIEVYVPSEVYYTDSVDLYFDYLKDGYIWVFPHGDTVCIGAANLFDRKLNYKDILSEFAADLGVDISGQKLIGAFLPYGYVIPQQKLADNILLVGDAGGFADPISGEGLYMALETGAQAARALLTDKPKQTYMKSVKPLIKTINDGRSLQKMFYTPTVQKAFFSKVRGRSDAVKFFFDNLVEEYRFGYLKAMSMYKGYKKR